MQALSPQDSHGVSPLEKHLRMQRYRLTGLDRDRWISRPVARGERFLCLSLGLVKAPASEDKLTGDDQTYLFNQSFLWHRRREDTGKLGNVCVMPCWMMGSLTVSYASFQLSVSKAPTLPVGSRPVSRVRWVLIKQNSDPGAASDAQKPPRRSKEEL